MSIKYNGKVLTIENGGFVLLAEKLDNEWVITYIENDGIPEYSCLPEFSTRILSDSDYIEKANLLEKAFKRIDNQDTIDFEDEKVQYAINKIILEENGQFKLI